VPFRAEKTPFKEAQVGKGRELGSAKGGAPILAEKKGDCRPREKKKKWKPEEKAPAWSTWRNQDPRMMKKGDPRKKKKEEY